MGMSQKTAPATPAQVIDRRGAIGCRGRNCWRGLFMLTMVSAPPAAALAALTGPGSIRRCLNGMGLNWRAPPIAPQAVFDQVA